MSAFNCKKENSVTSFKFNGFGGIDTMPEHAQAATLDAVNFRILQDGSIEKRCGFAPIANCPEEIRALWSGELDGEEATFILYGSIVASLDASSGTLSTVGNIDTSDGHASFIFYDSHLLLMDTCRFYSVNRDEVSSFEAYAPLYGKDWESAKAGEVNEPLNLATRHIRMTYNVTESLIYLRVDHIIESIDAVYKNGIDVTASASYYFDPDLMCVCIVGLQAEDRVELYLTVVESELNSSSLFSCKQSTVYGGLTDSRLFLWGGNDPKIMYGSLAVDDEALAVSQKVYGNTLPIYIPEHAAFTLGREARRITAACRQYDRLLVFTDTDTWMATPASGDEIALDAITVNSSWGCSAEGGAVTCENDPVCISRGTVLRWNADTDELNECNAYSISSKIDERLGRDNTFYTSAVILHDKSRSELLFSDPTNENGELWIYNYSSSKWYKFDGIGAQKLFLCSGKLGFVKDSSVYLFIRSLTHDVLSDGSIRKIKASFESQPTDLGIVGKRKRLLGMTLSAELYANELTVEYVGDGTVIASLPISGDTPYPTGVVRRLNSRRFSYVALRLISDSDAALRIYSSEIWAKT